MARKVQHEFTVARREPMPAGSLSSWQWIHESRMSRMACDECDAPGSGVELGTLEEVNAVALRRSVLITEWDSRTALAVEVGEEFARRSTRVLDVVCLPCARKVINADILSQTEDDILVALPELYEPGMTSDWVCNRSIKEKLRAYGVDVLSNHKYGAAIDVVFPQSIRKQKPVLPQRLLRQRQFGQRAAADTGEAA